MDNEIAISISRYFGSLPDPRRDHTRHHKLIDLVTIAICAVIAVPMTMKRWLRLDVHTRHGFEPFSSCLLGYHRMTPFGASFVPWTRSASNGAFATGPRAYASFILAR